MSERPYLPLFVEPLFADTGHLTDAEMGIYTRLLGLMWLSPECRIPNDNEWIARRGRPWGWTLEYVEKDVRKIISEYCKSTGNFVYQKRLHAEFDRLKKSGKLQSARAKSMWRKKKNPCRADDSGISQEGDPGISRKKSPAMPPQPHPQPQERKPPSEVKESGTPQAIRLPEDWHPEERGNAYAAEQGFSTSETADIAESFREHWHNKPGKDGRKIDWGRAWQTWVRNERRFRGEPSAEDLGPIDTSYVMPEELARKRRELKGLDEPPAIPPIPARLDRLKGEGRG